MYDFWQTGNIQETLCKVMPTEFYKFIHRQFAFETHITNIRLLILVTACCLPTKTCFFHLLAWQSQYDSSWTTQTSICLCKLHSTDSTFSTLQYRERCLSLGFGFAPTTFSTQLLDKMGHNNVLLHSLTLCNCRLHFHNRLKTRQ